MIKILKTMISGGRGELKHRNGAGKKRGACPESTGEFQDASQVVPRRTKRTKNRRHRQD